MVGEAAARGPVLAVFGSDKGPGDAERAAILSQAGAILARHGARVVLIADGALDNVPLVTGIRSAGGAVLVLADDGFEAPPALAEVPVERIDDPEARLRRIGELADVFVGLPGSLASGAALYRAWARAGAGASKKPVVLLNHHRAFESIRGFAADIFSHSIGHSDRIVTFTAEVEDLWNKVSWALNQKAA